MTPEERAQAVLLKCAKEMAGRTEDNLDGLNKKCLADIAAAIREAVEAERERALEVLGDLISDKLGPTDPVNAALTAAMFNIAHPDAPTRGRDDRPIDQSPASR